MPAIALRSVPVVSIISAMMLPLPTHSTDRPFPPRAKASISLNLISLRSVLLIRPLIKQGLSPYAILQSHPEIDISEKTIYTYIEDGTFKRAGVDLGPLDLRRQVSRKIKKKDKNHYKQRKDRKYLNGRLYKDYQAYIDEHPDARVVQMDTVYNNISEGPFMQTFKFMRYPFTIIIYHDTKDARIHARRHPSAGKDPWRTDVRH